MHFVIDLSLIPPHEPKYLHQVVDAGPSVKHLVDVMGQILQQMGLNLLPKDQPVRNLNELAKPAGMFTRCVRSKNIQSDIATKIMLLHPPSPENMKKVGELLKPHHTIEFRAGNNVVFSSGE